MALESFDPRSNRLPTISEHELTFVRSGHDVLKSYLLDERLGLYLPPARFNKRLITFCGGTDLLNTQSLKGDKSSVDPQDIIALERVFDEENPTFRAGPYVFKYSPVSKSRFVLKVAIMGGPIMVDELLHHVGVKGLVQRIQTCG